MAMQAILDMVLDSDCLSLVEVFRLLSIDKESRSKLTEKRIKKVLIRCPLQGGSRFRWWLQGLHADTKGKRLRITSKGDHLYDYLSIIQQLGVSRASGTSPGQIGEVMRDIKRTFPMHLFFLDGMPGQDMLARILQACIVNQPTVGYCQGMNFVVGALILSHPICSECPDQILSDRASEANPCIVTSGVYLVSAPPVIGKPPPAKFWTPAMHFNGHNLAEAESELYLALMALLDGEGKFGMQSVWKTGMPAMRLYNYQFDRLLKWNFPNLHNHFREIGFSPEIILSQWFLTFFIYTFPWELCLKLWDHLMHGGWPDMMRYALACFGVLEHSLVEMDLEELSLELRRWKCDKFKLPDGIQFEDIAELACSLTVNESELFALQEAFAVKLVSDAAKNNRDVSEASKPHLTVHDVAAVTKSIGRYLTNKQWNGQRFPGLDLNSKSVGLGLLSPFSHSGFLETPIEDFNSVANFNDQTQNKLIIVFNELVQINAQVESDKEIYLHKIVMSSQKLDSLKNELDVVNKKMIIASSAIEVIENELRLALEAETSLGGGSSHSGKAAGSSHGGIVNGSSRDGSLSAGPRFDNSFHDGAMLIAPYRELKIQTVDSNSNSPVVGVNSSGTSATYSPAKKLRSPAANSPSDLGILNIASYRKIRTPKNGDNARSPLKSPQHPSGPSSLIGHVDLRPKNKKSSCLVSNNNTGDVMSATRGTRRYIRGKMSSAAPADTLKKSSFEEINLHDDLKSPRSLKIAIDAGSNEKAVMDTSTSSTTSFSSTFSYFNSKKLSPPPGKASLLQAVKSEPRAAAIISADHSATTVASEENFSSEKKRSLRISPRDKKSAEDDLKIRSVLSASTTQFINEVPHHESASESIIGLGSVIGMAVNWAGQKTRLDSIFLRGELDAAIGNLKKLMTTKSELETEIEEEAEKKDRLCEQLQLVVEDMYRKRASILNDVIKKFVMM